MSENLKILVLSTLNSRRNKKNFAYFFSQLKVMFRKWGSENKNFSKKMLMKRYKIMKALRCFESTS